VVAVLAGPAPPERVGCLQTGEDRQQREPARPALAPRSVGGSREDIVPAAHHHRPAAFTTCAQRCERAVAASNSTSVGTGGVTWCRRAARRRHLDLTGARRVERNDEPGRVDGTSQHGSKYSHVCGRPSIDHLVGRHGRRHSRVRVPALSFGGEVDIAAGVGR
jgi:hypothetical protein